MLKVELHAHTADDPEDRIPYSTAQLLDRAAAQGYAALAITLHNKQLDLTPYEARARQLGLVLLRGIERTIEGSHLLVINAPADATGAVHTFDDLAALRASHPNVLCVAPHPFYPVGASIGAAGLRVHSLLIDAVEWSSVHTMGLPFNRAAARWARANGKPVVGSSDLHRLWQLARTYTLVDAAPEPDAICAAIRAGKVECRTRALPLPRFVALAVGMMAGGKHRVHAE